MQHVYAFNCRLPGSGSGSSLSELQFLAASRRAAAAAAGAVLPPGAPGATGAAGATGGGVAVPPPPPPHHPPGPDFHPAYRLNPYMEHLYSSLQQHSSPAASIHGQYSMFMSRYVEPQWLMKIPGKPCKHVVITAGLDTKKLSHYWPGQTLRAPGG